MKRLFKYRYSGITFVFISVVLQIVTVPFIHTILYAIAYIFHKPYLCQFCGGMDFYPLFLLYLFVFNCIVTFFLTMFQEIFKNNILINFSHLFWYLFIIWFSFGFHLVVYCIDRMNMD